MQFQFDVSAPMNAPPKPQPGTPAEVADLLRQMLDVQRDQLQYLRSLLAAQDNLTRWRAFIARWREEYPNLSATCREALPILERTYGKLMTELTEHLSENGPDALDNDFTLQEFLDRFGMRLAQLGTLLNLVGPLAEANPANDAGGQQT